MKHVKMLGLAAVAAMALMAFVGAAIASAGGVLCSTTASECPTAQKWATGTVLDFSLAPGESATFETTNGGVLSKCTASTIKGTLSANPSGSGEATSHNEALTWESCTHPATTIVLGGLKVQNIAGTSNGTVVGDTEIRWTYAGLFSGENCVYGVAAGTSIGTLTEGNPATLDVNATVTKTEPPGDSCLFGPSTAKWTATYTLTEPNNKTLSVSSAAAPSGALCSTTTTPCTSKWAESTTLDFSNTESMKLATTGGTLLSTCTTSTIEGNLTGNPETHGEATVHDEEVTWTGCTRPTTTINLGGLSIQNIASTSNGTVIADSQIRWTIAGLFAGETCVYGLAPGTSSGTLTEGNPATLDINAVPTKTEPTGDSCIFGPSTAKLTGAYTLTSPSGTTLSVSSS